MNKIIDSLLEYNNGDWAETTDDIMFEWICICGENGKCPECGSDMEYRTEREDRGEYWGEPAYEDMTYAKCPNCGYED